MSVILNRFSSQMPVLLIAGICAIPLLLLIAVVWRYERQRGLFKAKFLKNPISYCLLFMVFIPFFWYSTALLVMRLRAIPTQPQPENIAKVNPPPASSPPAATVNPPTVQKAPPRKSRPSPPSSAPQTYEQQCVGSACAQGPNSQATFNQYGAPNLAITDDQQKAIRDAMLPYAGLSFEIARNKPTPDSELYAGRLKQALADAGLVLADNIVIFRFDAVPSGVSMFANESGINAAAALEKVLVAQGLAKDKVPIQPTNNPKYDFMITVTPNH